MDSSKKVQQVESPEIFGVTIPANQMNQTICQAIRDIEAESRKNGVTITRVRAFIILLEMGMRK